MYNAVRKYLDSDTTSVPLGLCPCSLDLKLNKEYEVIFNLWVFASILGELCKTRTPFFNKDPLFGQTWTN